MVVSASNALVNAICKQGLKDGAQVEPHVLPVFRKPSFLHLYARFLFHRSNYGRQNEQLDRQIRF
jgi:hypothetical protein